MTKETSQTEKKTRAVKAKENKGRPERKPMVAGAKLTIPKGLVDETKFKPRWAADDPGRLNQYLEAGYEYVTDEKGNKIMRAGRVDMYLMKLPMEYYLEDKKLKSERVRANMLKEQQLGQDEYIPEDKKAPLQKESDLDPLA